MCHCETVEIELDDEDLKNKEEGEIEALVQDLAWDKIRYECPSYDAEDIIEMNLIEDE